MKKICLQCKQRCAVVKLGKPHLIRTAIIIITNHINFTTITNHITTITINITMVKVAHHHHHQNDTCLLEHNLCIVRRSGVVESLP